MQSRQSCFVLFYRVSIIKQVNDQSSITPRENHDHSPSNLALSQVLPTLPDYRSIYLIQQHCEVAHQYKNEAIFFRRRSYFQPMNHVHQQKTSTRDPAHVHEIDSKMR